RTLGAKNASNAAPSKVALIGARGYTGQSLISLLDAHPQMDLRHVSSRELAGKPLQGYQKREIVYENLSPEDVKRMTENGDVDCWVMALPNGVCKPFVEAVDSVESARGVVVDLSADYRFDNSGKWTYGLPELTPRANIAKATRISNPGCYATAAQLGIAPLVPFLGGQPTVFGVSGYSGAGTKPSPKNDVGNLTGNIIPYSLTDHIHEKEISEHLGAAVGFVPHVAVWFQGIHQTISIPLNKPMTSRDIRNLYQERYEGEKLVSIVGEPPSVKDIAGKHRVEIGGFAVHSSGKRVVVCATIDNLLKGAATQCLQNMNLSLGYVLTSREHGIATVWLVATLGSKSITQRVNRKAIMNVDVPKACHTVIQPDAPIALRLQGNLLYGISKVYDRQCGYALGDIQSMRDRMRNVIRKAKRTALDPEAGQAKRDQLILPDDPSCTPNILIPGLDADVSALNIFLAPDAPAIRDFLSSQLQSTLNMPTSLSGQNLRLDLSSSDVPSALGNLHLGLPSEMSSIQQGGQGQGQGQRVELPAELPGYAEEKGVLLENDFEFDEEGNIVELAGRKDGDEQGGLADDGFGDGFNGGNEDWDPHGME
ncbi:hypothetical protein KEM55_003647, partial [Ascosphaera atra]